MSARHSPVPEIPGLSYCDRFIWERVLAGVDLSPSARGIALTLAQYASSDGDDVRPGNARLAAASGAGTRTVERTLSLLRDSHLLIQTRRGTNVGGAGGTKALSSVHRLCAPTALVEPVASGEDVDAHGKGRALDFASLDPASLLSPCTCHPSNLAGSNSDLPVSNGGEVADLPAKWDELPANSNDLPAKWDELPVADGGLTTISTTISHHSSSATNARSPWGVEPAVPARTALGLMDEEMNGKSSGSAADVPPATQDLIEHWAATIGAGLPQARIALKDPGTRAAAWETIAPF